MHTECTLSSLHSCHQRSRQREMIGSQRCWSSCERTGWCCASTCTYIPEVVNRNLCSTNGLHVYFPEYHVLPPIWSRVCLWSSFTFQAVTPSASLVPRSPAPSLSNCLTSVLLPPAWTDNNMSASPAGHNRPEYFSQTTRHLNFVCVNVPVLRVRELDTDRRLS